MSNALAIVSKDCLPLCSSAVLDVARERDSRDTPNSLKRKSEEPVNDCLLTQDTRVSLNDIEVGSWVMIEVCQHMMACAYLQLDVEVHISKI